MQKNVNSNPVDIIPETHRMAEGKGKHNQAHTPKERLSSGRIID